MLNFFAIVLIIFIGLTILIFKNRELKNAINIQKTFPNKVKRSRKNSNKFLSIKKNFIYKLFKASFFKN